MCEQRLPADVPSCHSQGEADGELDLHLQPTASTEEARQRARPRSPLFGESCGELPLIVTARSVAELLVLSRSSSGSATSCSMCFASAYTIGTTGCASGQPPRALGSRNGAEGQPGGSLQAALWTCNHTHT